MTEPDDTWPPEGCPPLAWPDLPDQAARRAWYRAVIHAYQQMWDGHASAPVLAPVSDEVLDGLAADLGCTLPSGLRDYHLTFGAVSLAETLCGVGGPVPIQPLLRAFPGVVEIAGDDPQTMATVRELVAFGDGLGSGNLFCFHRLTGEVYFVDHDDGDLLTVMFSDVNAYLDALMVSCLAEIHEADDDGETLLVERLGRALVRKWKY